MQHSVRVYLHNDIAGGAAHREVPRSRNVELARGADGNDVEPIAESRARGGQFSGVFHGANGYLEITGVHCLLRESLERYPEII